MVGLPCSRVARDRLVVEIQVRISSWVAEEGSIGVIVSMLLYWGFGFLRNLVSKEIGLVARGIDAEAAAIADKPATALPEVD